MQPIAEILITVGGVMLLGLMTDLLGRKTRLPRVTLLLLFGMLIGPNLFDLLPAVIYANFDLIADVALLMVGFLVGGHLTKDLLKAIGRNLLALSLGAVIGTAAVVTLALIAVGVSLDVAILLGCIATATAPAATLDVVEQSGNKGPFAKLLVSIVALDDAWGLVLFSFGLAAVGLLNGAESVVTPLIQAFNEILGAILIGTVIGIPAAFLTGRIQPGKPILIEAISIVFLCGGLAIWFEFSFLIAAIVMGMIVVNLAEHHRYPFHAIENVEVPFLILFFVVAGASLEFHALLDVGLIGLVYILARAAGKIAGIRIGGMCCETSDDIKKWMGIALLPQAGVAMGMALVASNYMPEYRQLLLSVVISSTVVFELAGPVLTNMALNRAGKTNVS